MAKAKVLLSIHRVPNENGIELARMSPTERCELGLSWIRTSFGR